MYHSAVLLQNSDLTFGRILSDIPHDASAIVVYLMLGGFAYLIWRGSRKPRPKA